MSVGLVLLLLLTSLPQTMLTTYADIGKYGMRVVDGKGNVIPKGAVTITTVSGGDGETVVDECTYENNGGVWNDIMFDTDYRYRYNAWAKGYTSASGTLSVSDGDLQDFILKKKVRPQFYYEGDLEVAPGAELGPESVRGVDAWQYEGIKLAYMSSDTEVATVNDSGVVTKAGPGKTTISVSVAEDDLIYAQEEGGKSSYEITIKENTQLAFDTTVTDFVDVPLKGTYINKAHCLNRPDNPTITYSSDAGTVDVGEDGTVTLLEQDIYDYNEIVTITAQVDASADGVYQAADISYKIRRTKAECDIPLELTNKVHNMYIGQVSEHKANEDAVAGAVTYTSLNPDIVSCNGSTITALAPGMATIRVERAETGTHRPQMIEYKVEVYEREAAENLYEVIGDLGNNGWYKGDTQVNICAKEGHKLYRGENPYVNRLQ